MQVELKNTDMVEFSDLNEGDTFVINGNEVFMKIEPFQHPRLDLINAMRLNGCLLYKRMYGKDIVAKKNFKLVEVDKNE